MFFLLHRQADDGFFDDFPKIPDHFSKIAEGFRGRLEDVSIIHQRIYVQFESQTWYQWNHRYLHYLGYGKYATRVPDVVSYEFYEWCIFQQNTRVYVMKADNAVL